MVYMCMEPPGPRLNIETVFPGMRIFILKIRRPPEELLGQPHTDMLCANTIITPNALTTVFAKTDYDVFIIKYKYVQEANGIPARLNLATSLSGSFRRSGGKYTHEICTLFMVYWLLLCCFFVVLFEFTHIWRGYVPDTWATILDSTAAKEAILKPCHSVNDSEVTQKLCVEDSHQCTQNCSSSYWAWAQPMRDDFTLKRRLPLAEPISRTIPALT